MSTTVHINNSDSCIYSSFFPGFPPHSSPRCCKATNGMWDITTVRTDSLFHRINCELPGTEKGETHSHLRMQILWAFTDWNKWGSLLRAEQESLCVFPPNVLGTQSLHWDEALRSTQWHESLHLIRILNAANFFFASSADAQHLFKCFTCSKKSPTDNANIHMQIKGPARTLIHAEHIWHALLITGAGHSNIQSNYSFCHNRDSKQIWRLWYTALRMHRWRTKWKVRS